MGSGRNFELSLKNNIIENTNETVDAFRPDFSGNSKHTVADVVVVHESGHKLHPIYIEAKKRQAKKGNRATVMAGSSKGQSGIEELWELIEGVPEWGEATVLVKFDHKEAILITADGLLEVLNHSSMNPLGATEPRLTDGGNISMRKADEIPSQRSGREPWQVVCDYCNIEYE